MFDRGLCFIYSVLSTECAEIRSGENCLLVLTYMLGSEVLYVLLDQKHAIGF